MDFYLSDINKNKDNIYKGDNIIHLHKKDFKINKKEKVFINNPIFNNRNGFLIIYSPFCEICKNHAEQWEEYATLLQNRFIVSVLNAYGPDNEISSYLNVKGYPTIKLVKLDGSLDNIPFLSMEEYFNLMLIYSEKPI